MSTMKLILTQEVTGLGTSGDTVEVKGGYGRNYLLPRGLAIVATRGAEKQVESLRRARAARDVRSHEEAQAVAGQLTGLNVGVPARAGEGGGGFGGGGGGGFGSSGGGGGAGDPWSTPAGPSDEPPF